MPDSAKFLVRPLYMQAHDKLTSMIATGTWKAGDFLPSEQQLAKDFGVSAGTMRKALQQLEDAQIIQREQGRGTRVVDQNSGSAALRYSSLCDENDQKLISDVLEYSADYGSPSEEERLHLSIPSTESVHRTTRLRTYKSLPFMCETIVFPIQLFPGVSFEEIAQHRLAALALRHGLMISHAREAVKPVMCPDHLVEKFQIAEPAPILLLKRVAYDVKGRAVQYRVAWCHLQNAEYVSVTR